MLAAIYSDASALHVFLLLQQASPSTSESKHSTFVKSQYFILQTDLFDHGDHQVCVSFHEIVSQTQSLMCFAGARLTKGRRDSLVPEARLQKKQTKVSSLFLRILYTLLTLIMQRLLRTVMPLSTHAQPQQRTPSPTNLTRRNMRPTPTFTRTRPTYESLYGGLHR